MKVPMFFGKRGWFGEGGWVRINFFVFIWGTCLALEPRYMKMKWVKIKCGTK